MIGLLVGRQALGMERAETGLIAEERAVRHGHAAREQGFDRRIEPNDRHADGAEKFERAGLRISAATEGKDERFFQLYSAAERGAQLVRLDLAECCFAESLENFRNAQACGFLDAIVQINEMPGELARQERADSGL